MITTGGQNWRPLLSLSDCQFYPFVHPGYLPGSRIFMKHALANTAHNLFLRDRKRREDSAFF
jgi:hypothetical protein